MKGEAKSTFDPQIFLAKVGAGKTMAELGRRQIVFSQGDPADAVFYIQKGKIELKVLSQQGKEAILAILSAGDFFGEGCWSAVAHGDGCRSHRVLGHAPGKIGHDRSAPQGTGLLCAFHLVPADPQYPYRRR